jgi:hypothetical protein
MDSHYGEQSAPLIEGVGETLLALHGKGYQQQVEKQMSSVYSVASHKYSLLVGGTAAGIFDSQP